MLSNNYEDIMKALKRWMGLDPLKAIRSFFRLKNSNTMEQEFKDLIEEIKHILSPEWTPKNYEHNTNI